MNFQGMLAILASTQTLTSSLFSLPGLLNPSRKQRTKQPDSAFQENVIIYAYKLTDLFQRSNQFSNCAEHTIRFLNR